MFLSAKNLAVRYPNGALGIEDVSLEIEPGQIVALVGANGAGKTTTARALSGFLKTEGSKIVRGRIEVEGKNVTGWEPHRLVRAGISAVPERNKVFRNLTMREHFASAGMHRSRAQREEAVAFGLELFPMIKDRMSQVVGTMSGGQQQMVAIMRGLVGKPRLLIVDEMTLGLHASLQRPLFDALQAISAEGTACLVIDESLNQTMEMAQHCFVIENGRTVREGDASKFATEDLLAVEYAGS